ncbi:hypothetical protein EYS42_06710 [Aquabacterium lacunae]|uniref:Uncharacterized protein n=1 Tax=Aquabacterium lacunae TaxID=2528630 RepID=A0A4Q9H4B5_9BURK|nr:hypothetical protein [Aquabacterium lacunae]TBO32855.1 hypothetical protein EYS42_06710 [Aquabacterium lacunae]
MNRALIVLQLNEVNPEVLLRLVARGCLPNFQALLQRHPMVTTAVDEHGDNLEPWIQWVTAHTGLERSEHGAVHLSDAQHQPMRQVWDLLEEAGVACGLVSPMNASSQGFTGQFFIPDPWSTRNVTHPASLAPIHRFIAERVHRHHASLEIESSPVDFVRALRRAGVGVSSLAALVRCYLQARVDPRAAWRVPAALDALLWRLTLSLHRKHATRYTSVFLNAVAHYQHHYWTAHEPEHWAPRHPGLFAQPNLLAQAKLRPGDDPMTHGLVVYDQILGEAVAEVGAEGVMVMTGLSQVPFEGDSQGEGFCLYRPFDHQRLMVALGLGHVEVAPLMSRDMMLHGLTAAQQVEVSELLSSMTLNGRALFSCTPESGGRLFCKVAYTVVARPDDRVCWSRQGQARHVRFGDHFQLITFKTGGHHAHGFLLADPSWTDGWLQQGVLPLSSFPGLVAKGMGVSVPQSMRLAA